MLFCTSLCSHNHPPPRNISLQKGTGLALLLLIIHFVLILLEQNLKSGITDDALQQLHFINKQSWQWGYISTQPPLYSWLFKPIVDICSFLNLNFKFADSFFRQSLVMVSILISYLILRQHKIDQRNAIFSAFSLFLISEIGWSFQYNYTHTVLAVTTILLFILQFIRLLSCPTLQNYIFTGGSIACAVLSKYNTLLTIIGILCASLSILSARKVILRFRFLITVLMAFIICLPHFNWILSTRNPLITVKKVLEVEDIAGNILPILMNSSGILVLFIAQILPLLITLMIAFRLKYNWLKIMITGNGNQALLGRSFMITILIYLAFMTMLGARDIRMHWLLPAVLLLPLALPLVAFRIGKISQYGKSIFVSAVIVKVICFITLIIIDVLGDSWAFH